MSELLVGLAGGASAIAVTVFVRGTMVILAGCLVTRILERASAATRHGVWAVVFVALAALPLATPVLPTLTLTSPVPAGPVAHPASSGVAVIGLRGSGGVAGPDGHVTRATRDHGRLTEGSTGILSWAWRVAAAMAALVWLLGILVGLCRLGVHGVRAGRLVEGGIRPREGPVVAALKALGHAEAPVVLNPEACAPMVGGWRRPTVVLPVAAVGWSPALLRSVLMHELAHVERRDHATHLLARIVVALYWPNPLVHGAARRLARERERSCDDRALRSQAPHEYAGHLVEVARLVRDDGSRLTGALTMASGPTLRDRVRGILAPGVDRRPLSRQRLGVAAAVLAAVTLAVATLRIARAPAPDPFLFAALEHPDPVTRQRAAWALGEFESRRALGPLLQGAADPEPGVRGVAAWALGEIKDRRAVARLAALLRDDEDPFVREMAALALGEIGTPSAIAPLVNAASRETHVRPAVLWALGEIDHDSATTTLRELRFRQPAVSPWLDGADGFVRRTRGARPRPDTARNASAGDLDALVDIARRRDPAGLRDAIAALTAPDPATRAHAALATGRIGQLVAVNPLLRALRDPSIEVRAMAVWALDEINPSRNPR